MKSYAKPAPKIQTIGIKNPDSRLEQVVKKQSADLICAINGFNDGTYSIQTILDHVEPPRVEMVRHFMSERSPIYYGNAKSTLKLASKYAQIGCNPVIHKDFYFSCFNSADTFIKNGNLLNLPGVGQYELENVVENPKNYSFSLVYRDLDGKWVVKLISTVSAPPRMSRYFNSKKPWLHEGRVLSFAEVEELGSYATYLSTMTCGMKYVGAFSFYKSNGCKVYRNYWGSSRFLTDAIKNHGLEVESRQILGVFNSKKEAKNQERKLLLKIGYEKRDKNFINMFFSHSEFNPLPLISNNVTLSDYLPLQKF